MQGIFPLGQLVVGRFRVSGLVMRPFTRRGPYGKSASRVQVGVALLMRSN
jgi:hypothetical protein